MHPRIFKFYGKAISSDEPVSVTAMFNGVQIHSGPVPTATSMPVGSVHLHKELLFEYQGTVELSGKIPLEISAINGTVLFGLVEANYSGVEFDVDYTDPENPVVVVDIPPENFWEDVNQNSPDTDGKTNVVVNGIDLTAHSFDGDWWYPIPPGGTLTCDIFVDPNRIVTSPPGIEEAIDRLANDAEPE
jgi:hypothetical protein